MKKSFLSLAGFFVGMMFVAETSSGYFSMLIQNPLPQTAQRHTQLQIPEISSALTPPSKKIMKKEAARSQKKTKPSESYVNQLSALRYVMRSA